MTNLISTSKISYHKLFNIFNLYYCIYRVRKFFSYRNFRILALNQFISVSSNNCLNSQDLHRARMHACMQLGRHAHISS